MSDYTKLIDDAATGKVTIVELTADEADARDEEIAANIAAKAQRIAQAETNKAAALEKLAALGLEPSDLKALGIG